MGLFTSIYDDFISLDDTPTTYSGGQYKYVRVNENNNLVYFNTVVGGVTVSGTTPPDPSYTTVWYNNGDFITYHWDPVREEWLSNDLHNYLFTYQGNIDGLYLSIGDLRHSYAHYLIPRPASVTGIIAAAERRNNSTKGFDVRDDGSTLFSFNMSNWEYVDMDASVHLDTGTKLQMFCQSAGGRVRNPGITLEIRWRYVAP